MGKSWYKSKTIWVGFAGVVYAIAGYVSGNLGVNEAIIAGEVGLAAIGLRLGFGNNIN